MLKKELSSAIKDYYDYKRKNNFDTQLLSVFIKIQDTLFAVFKVTYCYVHIVG